MFLRDTSKLNAPIQFSQRTVTQIESMLSQSEEFERFLEMILKTCPGIGNKSDIPRIQKAIAAKLPAVDWLTTPSLACKLPLLIRFKNFGLLQHDEVVELAEIIHTGRFNWKGILLRILYPLILLCTVLGIALLILLFVIPNFAQMFNEFGLRVPTVTKAVIGLSEFLRQGPLYFTFALLLFFLTPIAIWLAFRAVLSAVEFISLIGFWTAGSKRKLEAMARWSSTLADLIDIDIPLPDALAVAGVASHSRLFNRQSRRLANLLQSETKPLATALTDSAAYAFPEIAKFALVVNNGTPSTSLLRQQSVIYQVRATNRRIRGGGLFGPLAVVSIGLFVALIIIAIFMPLVSLVTALS